MPRPGLGALVAQTLRDGVAQCRAVCLELVAQSNVAVGGRDARQVVRLFRKDPAAVVRVASLQALQTAWRPVAVEVYEDAVASLADDDALVRREAVKLVGIVAQDHPEPLHDARAGASRSVRMPDACFMQVCCCARVRARLHAGKRSRAQTHTLSLTQVCGAFFDSDWHVREPACRVLGSIPSASPYYLIQV